MPYTKEQLRVYWQTHKVIFNQKRREKRRLAKLGLTEQVSHNSFCEVSHLKVSQKQEKVSYQSLTTNPKTTNLNPVSHSEPGREMANPILIRLIKEWQTGTNYNCALGCFMDRYCNNC